VWNKDGVFHAAVISISIPGDDHTSVKRERATREREPPEQGGFKFQGVDWGATPADVAEKNGDPTYIENGSGDTVWLNSAFSGTKAESSLRGAGLIKPETDLSISITEVYKFYEKCKMFYSNVRTGGYDAILTYTFIRGEGFVEAEYLFGGTARERPELIEIPEKLFKNLIKIYGDSYHEDSTSTTKHITWYTRGAEIVLKYYTLDIPFRTASLIYKKRAVR
jgi:hypothetical protein